MSAAWKRHRGRRSPIIDVEHMQLFCEKSLRELFLRSGYRDLELRGFVNRYPVGYWLRLTPLPQRAKAVLARFPSRTRLDRISLA